MTGVEATTEARASEAELLQRTGEGDAEAIEALLELHHPRVRRIVRGVYRIRSGDAEDIYQKVRIRFFRHARRVRYPRAFLDTLAVTACLQHLRTVDAEKRALVELAIRQPPPHDGARRHEQRLIDRMDIERTLTKMTPRCAELVRGVVLQQTPQSEYARTTGTPLGTIASSVARCLRKLRAALLGKTKGEQV